MIYSREFLANLPEEYKHKCQNIIKEMSPEKFKEFIYKTDNNILPYLFKTEMENFKINSDPSYGVGSKLLYKIQ